MSNVILRARDKLGRLIRRIVGLPDWVHVDEGGQRIVPNPIPFEAMFKQIGYRAGWEKAKTQESWNKYKELNPKLGKPCESFH